jgi:hypothetical protein
MQTVETTTSSPNSTNALVRRSLFGYKHFFLDKKTRIEYGFHLSDLGISYKLQRKGLFFWSSVAWTYPSTHKNENLQSVINYLLWYEEKYSTKNVGCHF